MASWAYFPVAQEVHSAAEPPEIVPAAHASHVRLPLAAAYVDALHAVHDGEAAVAANWPAAQSTQMSLPGGLVFPGAHARHRPATPR